MHPAPEELNYFTCTLGEAAKYSLTNPAFTNINAFLDYQAENIPDQPAVGFFRPASSDGRSSTWSTKCFTFAQVRAISLFLSQRLMKVEELGQAKTAALLCPSSADFLFIWLALIRLDIAVLLLAPQCQPDAIVHLCKECDANVLLFDGVYKELAHQSAKTRECDTSASEPKVLTVLDIATVVGNEIWTAKDIDGNSHRSGGSQNSLATKMQTAYIHHTSGTSSGLPKPVPQSHNAAVGALPSLVNGKDSATFTTTPLYHGGVADAFRSWTSGAMIWLYPGKDIPITGPNIVTALDAAGRHGEVDVTPPIKYFSSVPYVLQLLEEEPQGIAWLRRMDIVGVGGASLPAEVGDRLVAKGINLVSRFGSSECGFIMSSHRDYARDKDWQHLRDNVGPRLLRLEPRDDGLSELVILPQWPHRAKTNRDDGSFVTSDLFEAHSDIPNAWRYHSRADSQLTLITGKKFDPAPLEGTLADSKMLSDVVIFGNGKPYPGALLFRSQEQKDSSDDEVLAALWLVVEELNTRSQDHARLAKGMLKPMAWQETGLEKSSKGTLLRKKAEERFAEEIEAAYSESDGNQSEAIHDDDVQGRLLEIVKQTLGKSDGLTEKTELFNYGVDSIAAMRIRGRLQSIVGSDKRLPATIVENCGTVERLSEALIDLRSGKTSTSNAETDLDMMLKLVDTYSSFKVSSAHLNGFTESPRAHGEVVVMTGATGALGAHVFDLCARHSAVTKIICLIRGEDEHAARERLRKALEQRKLVPLDEAAAEVVVLPCRLGDDRLGLKNEVYAPLAGEVTLIFHLAWEVNFRMSLRNFRSNSIASVANLINLALHAPRKTPPKFMYCSSVASVLNTRGTVPEIPSDDPRDATKLGYSQSKWVAEQICKRASEQTALKGSLSILRVGQLAGDSKTGVWNEKEAWPMMLSTVKLTRSLPDLKGEPLNWLPVDTAAQSFVDAGLGQTSGGKDLRVAHVLNQQMTSTWKDLLRWLKQKVDFEVVAPEQWIAQLEDLQSRGIEHPAFKLIDHWKGAICTAREGSMRDSEASSNAPVFEISESIRMAPVLANIKPVDEAYFTKIWQWIDATL